MSVKDYIKEKKYLFLVLFVSFFFCLLVFWANEKLISSSTVYMLQGLCGFFIIYIVTDFFIMRTRAKKMKQFIRQSKEENFSYPLDKIYASEIIQLLNMSNTYKTNIEEQYSDELDFITKWVHDIKVPISALYLLIDSLEESSGEKLEMQTAYIEQHTQKVLYHIKSKSFHDDYKIAKTSTKAIVSTALKQFATFFAHKKIALTLHETDYKVLTDEKWSGYIVSQFLSNAIKHTPQNGEITINTFSRHNAIIISVKNTGEGIESASLDQIFNKGYTSHFERGTSSTGYGLYLAKKLADRMGHDLFAVSRLGEYTEFCLSFSQTDIYDHITKS